MSLDKKVFVNPYTFVPFPGEVKRESPPGHLPGPESGVFDARIEVTWTCVTPLLLPKKARSEGWVRPDGSVRIPGSSIKGAVRSLHEAMFNGCLRVFEDEFVPVYRQAAAKGAVSYDDGWCLGRVEEAANGVPTLVSAYPNWEWVEAVSLRDAYSAARLMDLPSSGDVITYTGTASYNNLREADEIGSVHNVTKEDTLKPPSDSRILHVTNRTTRQKNCFWAAAIVDESPPVPVSAEAAELFYRACLNAEDRRRLLHTRPQELDDWTTTTQYGVVRFNGQPVGKRALTTGVLHKGDVAWFKLEESDEGRREVTEIRLSAIWREPGKGSAGSRVPEFLKACTDPQHLCLSCEVFGSVDANGDTESAGDQNAYAGHIRLGAARSSSQVELSTQSIAPLRNPRPGTGSFYLVDKTQDHAVTPDEGDIRSHWGHPVDRDRARPLRGRKFYWTFDPQEQADAWNRELGRTDVQQRHQRRHHQAEDGERELVPAGTVFAQEILLDGVTEAGLYSVVLAVDPAPLLGLARANGSFGIRLGGGKPFGLGVVKPEIRITAFPSAHRYVTSKPEVVQSPDLGTMAKSIVARSGSLSRVVEALARVLDMEGLGQWKHHVSYPPGAGWDHVDTESFDKSFNFFRGNNGQTYENRTGSYQPLPAATDPNPTQDI